MLPTGQACVLFDYIQRIARLNRSSQPFSGIKSDTFHDSNTTWIELIDGSSNQENMPLSTLLVKAREVDVVVAVDGSSDSPERWPK